MSFKCPDCINQYDKLISLSLHYRKGHKKTAKDLYVAMNFAGTEPTCKCGCGSAVKFLDITRGFSDYVHGHAAKVPGKNNWGNNPSAKEKSFKTRTQMLENGSWKPFVSNKTGKYWNEGLTATTDARVAKTIATRDTPEYKVVSSQRMKENRLNGTIPTLAGSAHSQWNGGTSSLFASCHSSATLYSKWKYPRLEQVNFTCQQCGLQRKAGNLINLHVHHDKVTMATIVRLVAEECSWEQTCSVETNADKIQALKSLISDKVANYHIQHDVSGIVLCDVCHKTHHPKMNFKKAPQR